MRAGDLRYQITIEQRTDTQDAAGQPIPAWSTLATVAAAYEPQGGREFYTGAGQVAQANVRFRIRGRTDVTDRHRVTFGGKVYDIKDVVTDGQGRETTLFCDTGLTQG